LTEEEKDRGIISPKKKSPSKVVLDIEPDWKK
jgi:hypothetical protein